MAGLIQTVAISLGAFIGAGFISGKEVATFFCGSNNLFGLVIITFASFFIFTLKLFLIGNKNSSLINYNKLLFKNFYKVINYIYLICAFISVCAMLSGIESLFNIRTKIPYLTIISLLIVNLIVNKGIKKIAIFNMLLVPIMLISVVALLIYKGEFVYFSNYANNGFNSVKAVLYSTMNLAFSFPILVELGSKNSKVVNVISAIVISLVLSVLIYFMAAAINYEGANAINYSMPLLFVAKNNVYIKTGLSIIIFFAILTTLLASLHSLKETINVKNTSNKNISVLILNLLIIICSRLGLNFIVEYLYPIVGVLGLAYITYAISYDFFTNKKSIKRINFISNEKNKSNTIKIKGE